MWSWVSGGKGPTMVADRTNDEAIDFEVPTMVADRKNDGAVDFEAEFLV